MGTHPSGMSLVSEGPFSGKTLMEYIRDNPEILGKSLEKFGIGLPYLFKVLSVRTALSIQSHPDKKLAERLHLERPDVYKDNNHKPEMAIALSNFEAMCGFCSHEEIVNALETNPELISIIGSDVCESYKMANPENYRESLKRVFSILMKAEKADVKTAIMKMVHRLEGKCGGNYGSLSKKENLILRLNSQYPNDVGVLAAWFLNFIDLNPGEAIALPANEPHAYVNGEIIECMATSDNVIRAGLTPKMRDTDTLCNSLTYNQGMPEIMQGDTRTDLCAGASNTQSCEVLVYQPNFSEFEVTKMTVKSRNIIELPAAQGPMIMLVHHGKGKFAWNNDDEIKNVVRGNILLVPSDLSLKYSAAEDSTIWIAAPNQMGI